MNELEYETKGMIEELRRLRGAEDRRQKEFEQSLLWRQVLHKEDLKKVVDDHEEAVALLKAQHEARRENLAAQVTSLKKDLEGRPHIPNKVERKVMRQERAKEGRTRDKLRR